MQISVILYFKRYLFTFTITMHIKKLKQYEQILFNGMVLVSKLSYDWILVIQIFSNKFTLLNLQTKSKEEICFKIPVIITIILFRTIK